MIKKLIRSLRLIGRSLGIRLIFLCPDTFEARNPAKIGSVFNPLKRNRVRQGRVKGILLVASALWLNSPLLTGPLSHLFGDSDMSVFTGFIVAGLLYWLLARSTIARAVPAHMMQPEAEVKSSSGS